MPALLCAVAVWVGVWAGLDTSSGLRSWWRLRVDLAETETRIAALRSEVASLREEERALESEQFALERAIREDLELALPGETVVRLPRAHEKDIVGSLPGALPRTAPGRLP
jgi:cell division protein FtsB